MTDSQGNYPAPALVESPYEFFDNARQDEPVRFDPETDVYQLFRHDDIMFVLRHGELFPHTGATSGSSYQGVPTISGVGPPEHTAMRRLAFGPFKPGRLTGYDSIIEGFAETLIDRFIDRGEVELVEEFAIPLPALVTCRLMGLPESRPEFDFIVARMSMKNADRPGVSDQGLGEGRHAGRAEIHAYLREALLGRYEHPRDDILTEFVQTQVERDGSLDLPYLTTICTELLSGGVITTAQMVVNAMALLLEHPSQLARVREDHSLIPRVLEEALRIESPVQSLTRICVADCELRGVRIPAGAKVLMVFGSGNRDPGRFAHPDEFNLDRPRDEVKTHFGFGQGRHFCLGAPLARREGQIAFQSLFARMKEIRLGEQGKGPRYIASTHFRALRSLTLEFEKA